MSQIFDCINEQKLVSHIESAVKRIICVSPGITKSAIDALQKAASTLGPENVTLILDPSPWVYRMGYGTVDGLNKLSLDSITIRRCSGIRIGLIVCDENAFIYTPIPTMLEKEPQHSNTPNAIRISPMEAMSIVNALISSESALPPEIATERMNQEELDYTKEDLEKRPPIPAALSQQMNVISSEFQFVEIKFRGGKIHQRTFSLDAKDLGVKSKVLSRHIKGTFKIFSEKPLKTFDALGPKLQKIHQRYLKTVAHYGTVVDYRDKVELVKAFEAFDRDLNSAKEDAIRDVAAQLSDSRLQLKNLLMRNFKKLGKSELSDLLYPDETDERSLEVFIERYLDEKYPKAEEILDEVHFTWEFRMISSEHLSDDRFKGGIQKVFGRNFEDMAKMERAIPEKRQRKTR